MLWRAVAVPGCGCVGGMARGVFPAVAERTSGHCGGPRRHCVYRVTASSLVLATLRTDPGCPDVSAVMRREMVGFSEDRIRLS